MITGIGIDMIETERIHTKIAKEHGFREFVFSKSEIEYCESETAPYEHYAARFAAKEAFLKAVGAGWKNGTSLNEIEISNDDAGKPRLTLLGETAISLSVIARTKISVSLAHLKMVASAIVILES